MPPCTFVIHCVSSLIVGIETRAQPAQHAPKAAVFNQHTVTTRVFTPAAASDEHHLVVKVLIVAQVNVVVEVTVG